MPTNKSAMARYKQTNNQGIITFSIQEKLSSYFVLFQLTQKNLENIQCWLESIIYITNK